MQIKGKAKTQRALCHRPLTTASSMSRDDVSRLSKRFISYLYVCMHIRMHVLVYLFIYFHTKNVFRRGQESGAICPGLNVPRHSCWFQGTRDSCRFCLQRSSLDPLSFREASRGKQQPSPNTDVWLWAAAICRPVVHSITSPNEKGRRGIPQPWLKMP